MKNREFKIFIHRSNKLERTSYTLNIDEMCISFSFINQSILSFKTNFPFQKRKIYPTFALSPPKRIYSSKLTRTEGKILFTGIQSRSTLSKHSRTLNFSIRLVETRISPSLSLSESSSTRMARGKTEG